MLSSLLTEHGWWPGWPLSFHGWKTFWPRNGSMKLKKNWHSLLPAYLLFLGLFLQHHSLAYQFTEDLIRGSFWRTFPIPLKLQIASNDSRYGLTEQALTEAIDEWQKHSEIQLWDYREGGSTAAANNVIRWSNNFEKETGYAANSTMAITVRYSSPPLLQRTEIIINGQYFGLTNIEDLRKILIHELGHTLGLDHSEEYGSLMYRTLALGDTSPSYLSNDDIEGLSQVMIYHTQKQSEPIQLEQGKSGSSNPLDSIAGCGQNNQDQSSFSPAESERYKKELMSWFVSLLIGITFFIIGLNIVKKLMNFVIIQKQTEKNQKR